jgi:hypothetical protein
MEITLTKTRKYELEPYGKFVIKSKTRQGHLPNIIPLDELHVSGETGMPMSDEEDKKIVGLMKKHKTDILTDGRNFYTRTGYGFTEVYHKKLRMYKEDLAFKQAVDAGHTWGRVMLT